MQTGGASRTLLERGYTKWNQLDDEQGDDAPRLLPILVLEHAAQWRTIYRLAARAVCQAEHYAAAYTLPRREAAGVPLPSGVLCRAGVLCALRALIFFRETGSSDFPAEEQSSIQQPRWDQKGEYVRSAATSPAESGNKPLICPTGGKTAMLCWALRATQQNIRSWNCFLGCQRSYSGFTVWWSVSPCLLTPLLKLSGTKSFHRAISLGRHEGPADWEHLTPGLSSPCPNQLSASPLPVTTLCLPLSSHSI